MRRIRATAGLFALLGACGGERHAAPVAPTPALTAPADAPTTAPTASTAATSAAPTTASAPTQCETPRDCAFVLASCPHPGAANEAICVRPWVEGVHMQGTCQAMCAVADRAECSPDARCPGARGDARWSPFRGGDVPGHLAGECFVTCDAW